MESANQKTQYHQPWKIDKSRYSREWAPRKQLWTSEVGLFDREKSGLFLKPQSLLQFADSSRQGLQSRFRENGSTHHVLQHLPSNSTCMREDIVFPNFYNHLGFMQQEGPYYGAVSSQWIAAGTELIKLNPEPFAAPLLKPPWSFIQNSSFPERGRMWNPAVKPQLHCEYPPMETVRNMEQDFLRPSASYTSSPDSKGGSYQEKINLSINHPLEDPAIGLPFATCEPENVSFHSNNNSPPVNGTIDLTDPSQDSKDESTCESEENKFLLIDDRGIPYTVFKKDLINSEETGGELDEDSQIPKRFHYCPLCFRSFLYLSDLERHSITHSEHKPFECKVCGKSFKRSSHLQRHKHIHTGERPFQCIICKKGFRESGELQRHQRVHTGEKPYQCELCHLRFTERNTLRRHTKRKHLKELLYQQDPGDSSDWGEVVEDIATEDNIE
ncbi:zinc finger and SCAN domain-containing protein 5A [Xenopus laevis]|uniref:C2H2-type domain-containing protein n=2 Tax=Xenopus laevis TaxID=8355 RepID=A0A974CD88_XENLA|nr:zinc finger and SCAN domain-containing protein 5A [Xenopus laevis]OCT70737.1 hypothetical protein XELAEV_18037662mg [Xenopus laevis]